MPGIVGIISNPLSPDKAGKISSMVACMMHETFYTSRICIEEKLGVAAGCIGLHGAFAECSPIWNEKKDVCLIFSGEEFSDSTVLTALRTKGHQFEASDASYLVHLYEENEAAFFGRLNGWFSGLLLDFRQEKAVLFNDRYGLNRIYYHESGGEFHFASEAKALLKTLPKLRQMDMRSLGEFFSCGCVLENRTLFSGVFLLPPGSAWTFSKSGRVNKEFYFKPAQWENLPVLGADDYYAKLDDTFTRVLPRYFRNPGKLGMSLTGGVDSRMIIARGAPAAGTLPCYTFGGIYRDCSDVKIARRVAKACKQSHCVISVNGEFLPEFPALAEKAVYVSDGAMDVTGAVELFINRVARQIAPTRLTGNYGGEILRKLIAFKPDSRTNSFLQPEFTGHISEAEATYARARQDQALSFIAFKQVPWHHFGRLAVEQSQLTLRSPYLDNELVALAYQAPAEFAERKDWPLRLIAGDNPELGGLGTDRGRGLRKIPVISEAQQWWREFTFKAEYAYDYGMPQWLAHIDHALAPLHPERMLLGRHKFYHYRVWYRDAWANYLQEYLLDSRSRSRSYLSPRRLEEMVRGHISGNWNYTSEINKLLTTEIIYRKLLEQN